MNNLNWQGALKRLQDGNEHFVEDHLDGKLQNSSRRKKLVSDQHPYALVLSCSDSRVVPELAFDTGLGEIFVIRVAGNIANPSTIASIEYAVLHLGVKLVVVMGHENCGAVTAALEGRDLGKNLNHLIGFIRLSVEESVDKSVNAIAKLNAQKTAQAIIMHSDIIQNAVKHKHVKVITAYYNLDTGKVDFE